MKKMFSRLLPAVLGMMVLSATPAFAQVNADAKAVYEDMAAKSMLMSDANMYLHMNMIMGDGTQTMNMAADMNMLFNNMNQPDKMQFLCQNVFTIEGQQMNSLMWYKDGYTYMEAAGEKIKTKTDMQSSMQTALDLNNTLGMSTDLFSDLYLSTEGETRYLNYKFDDAKMNALMTQMFDSMGFGSLLSSTGMQMRIYDVKGSYILTPDNLYSAATISMSMDVTAQGETLSVIVAGNINMLNMGQPVQIAFPDPAGYVEQLPGQSAA